MAPAKTPIAFTIAGSDPSGGAGLQADLKTFCALGVYGCAAVSALTAQNTRGVSAAWPLPVGSVQQQITTVLEDVPVKAIKLGMLFDARTINEVAEALKAYPTIPVICDPVMVATSGDRLLSPDAVQVLIEGLFPRSELITPNLAEAAALLNGPQVQSEEAHSKEARSEEAQSEEAQSEEAHSEEEMAQQARALLDLGPGAVLLKGGHLDGQATDLLLWREAGQVHTHWLRSPRIKTSNTHGTGCSLSAAIAAWRARGDSLPTAVEKAKHYISGAIAHADELRVGSGAGPVNHFWKSGSPM